MNTKLGFTITALSAAIVAASATADARSITGNSTILVGSGGAFITPSNCVTENNAGIKAINRPHPNISQCNDNTPLSNIAFITPLPIDTGGSHSVSITVTGANVGIQSAISCTIVSFSQNGTYAQSPGSATSNGAGSAIQTLPRAGSGESLTVQVVSGGNMESVCHLPVGFQGIATFEYNP
jgi:hypothetical protein